MAETHQWRDILGVVEGSRRLAWKMRKTFNGAKICCAPSVTMA
ncbi:hypothetical protein [Paraburkholderia kirstenboschensis]